MLGMFVFLQFLIITTVQVVIGTIRTIVGTTTITIKILGRIGQVLNLVFFGVPIKIHARANRSAPPRSHNPRQSLGSNKY